MTKFISAKAKVSSKGWAVIPKEIREVLGVKPGDEVRFTYWPPSIASGHDRGRLHVRKVAADPVAATAGIIKRRPGEPLWTLQMVEEHRMEVEKEEREMQEARKAREAQTRSRRRSA
jgi:AbrB family looped-hinge helix DNA binding protein